MLGAAQRTLTPRSNLATNLPPEILVIIFHLVSASSDAPLHWIAVTHVCLFWRQVALHEPSLWKNISARLPLRWIDEYYRRSDPFPLNIEYWDGADEVKNTRFGAIILEAMHRLGSVKLRRYNEDSLSRFNKPTPLLKFLDLATAGFIPQDFLGGQAPCLRSFHLTSLSPSYLPIGVKWLSNLRSLRLWGEWGLYDEKTGTPIEVTVSSTLNLLGSLPHLEDLLLELPHASASQPPYTGTPIHLPHLKAAEFFLDTTLVDVLRFITVDSPIVLAIRLESGVTPRLEPACDLFARNSSGHPLDIICSGGIISISVHKSCPLRLGAGLTLSFPADQVDSVYRIISSRLLSFCAVQSLRIQHGYGNWLVLVQGTVDTLDLGDAALHYLLTMTSLPPVRHLVLHNAGFRRDDFSKFRKLIEQHGEGGGKLEQLTMRSSTRVSKNDIATLRRYVRVKEVS